MLAAASWQNATAYCQAAQPPQVETRPRSLNRTIRLRDPSSNPPTALRGDTEYEKGNDFAGFSDAGSCPRLLLHAPLPTVPLQLVQSHTRLPADLRGSGRLCTGLRSGLCLTVCCACLSVALCHLRHGE